MHYLPSYVTNDDLFRRESFNQWSVVGFSLVSTVLIISSIVSICTSTYEIFALKRKIARLQKTILILIRNLRKTIQEQRAALSM